MAVYTEGLATSRGAGSVARDSIVHRRPSQLKYTGAVRAEHAYWETSWGALTIEVGNRRPLRHGELSCPW
eukprot:scaffold5538_cov90-Phaeocystis_antarctica.AAC.1